jgi:hypothetical protein
MPEPVKPAATSEVDTECSLISRYLIGVDPPQEFKDRYRAGQRALFGEESLESAEPEMKFFRAHPWALPYLDAGAVVLNRESILRKKIILMTAILEASPAYAEFFLHAPEGPLKVWCSLVWQSVRSIVKMIIAVPVFLVARRSR